MEDRDEEEYMEEVLEEEEEEEEEESVVVEEESPSSTGLYEHRPCCVVCSRGSDEDGVRLFLWPRSSSTRRQWCAFFDLDEADVSSNFAHSFICSFHFDADHFLYSDCIEGGNARIFWSPAAFPRYRLRRPHSPFHNTPNTAAIIATKKNNNRQRKRCKLPPPTVTDVHFRQSKFKIEGKVKHPVAVIRLPGNPDLFYEFSYNRTSHIDGTKFYSCLQCRKAKLDTKVKDCIRTIHLNQNKILSRGDPLSGHHFACRPYSEEQRKRMTQQKEDMKMQRMHKGTLPRRKKVNHMEGQQLNTQDDESIRWDQFEDPDEGIAEEEEPNISLSYQVGGQPISCRQRSSLLRLRPATQRERWRIAALRWAKTKQTAELKTQQHAGDKMPRLRSEMGGLSAVQGTNLNLPSRTTARNDRRATVKVVRRGPGAALIDKPKCYICKLILGGPKQLAEHLIAHVNTRYKCRSCGKTDGADVGVKLRRLKLCRACFSVYRRDRQDQLIIVD